MEQLAAEFFGKGEIPYPAPKAHMVGTILAKPARFIVPFILGKIRFAKPMAMTDR